MEPLPPLPGYSARQLGPERAALAAALRERLWGAGLRWPRWLDARPGRLGIIIGDLCEPPLGLARRALGCDHAGLLVEGLGALGLAFAAGRLAVASDEPASLGPLVSRLGVSAIELLPLPPLYPAQPAAAVAGLVGAAWVVPAELLAAAGAALRGIAPPRLVAVVGAVREPQALPANGEWTPRALVARAGGAEPAAWVALAGEPLSGELVTADALLPPETTVLYILPARHPLVRRHRLAVRQRARAVCLGCRLCTDACPQAPQGTAPHRILQALARRELAPSDITAAAGCIACGACSVACPAELLPGAVVSALAAALPSPDRGDEPPAPPRAVGRPRDLVLRRLDLARYVR